MAQIEDRETLYETLAQVERQNQRLATELAHANTLLNALSKLLLIGPDEDPFAHVFTLLRDVFRFEAAAAFAETAPGVLVRIAASVPIPGDGHWVVGTFLAQVLGGRVVATLDNRDIPECRTLPGTLLAAGGSSLFMPLNTAAGRALLMLTRPPGCPGFDVRDIELAKRFSLLASHALMAFANRSRMQSQEIRAAAAEDANRAKNQFIASMSHELRTPLNAIIGFSDFIASEVLGPIGNAKYAEYVRDINVSGNHLLTEVDNILLYSKMEAGQHKAELVDLPLGEILEQVLRLLTNKAEQAGIGLDVHPVAAGLRVRADRLGLRLILVNLIGNAIKFSPRGNLVTIAGRPESDRYRLTIVDRGIGIAPAILETVGTPFFRAENVMVRQQHQGTGLGLAISIGLAKSMEAAIAIDSEEHKGTAVHLDLTLSHTGLTG